jgi:2-dehydropantoate 2-reductase
MYQYDYLIIGPGAMGLFIAAKLSHAGLRVAILDYKPERASVLNDTGINLITDGITLSQQITVTSDPQIASQSRVCIIITKSYNTINAGEEILPFINDNAILTLQNGLGNVETLSTILNDKIIIAGSTTQGALRINSNTVQNTGDGMISIGNNSPITLTICNDFIKAGMKTIISENIEQVLWGKAVINSAINPLGAITNRKNGELLLSTDVMDLMKEVITESVTVANSMGINISINEYLKKTVNICRITASNTNSMLTDINNKKRTEIDAINGKITEYGEKLNIPVQVNRTLWKLIKTLEN